MKIYKVNLDPSNPIEKLVKVPVGSDYGIQISWDNERFPTFTDSNVATQNGYLVSENGTATEMTDITTVNGQKTFLGENNISLPKVSKIDDTIVWYYNPTNTTDKTTSTFGSIKILGVDADDFEIDLGSSGGGSSFEYITETDNTVCINANTYIKSSDGGTYTYYVNGGICTNSNGCIWICADTTYIKGNSDVRIFSYGHGMGMTIQSSGDLKLNSGNNYNVYINGSPVGGASGVVDGLYNIPAEVLEDDAGLANVGLDPVKTVYKYIPTGNKYIFIDKPIDSLLPDGAIMTFWLWIIMGNTAHELTFQPNVTFIDSAPALAANTQTMLALTSTDDGSTWLANTQWVK